MLNVPAEGDMDQLTPVLLAPVTVALNVVDWPPVSEAVAGVMLIITPGFKVMTVLALLLGSAALVAVMATVSVLLIGVGAV